MQLRIFLQMLRRNWWVIALTAISAVSLAIIYSYLATPLYRTSARFLISPGPSVLASQDRDLLDSIEALDKRSIVATYAEVLASTSIHRQVGSDLGLDPIALRMYKFYSIVLPDASVLELSVEGPDPNMVTQLANNIGREATAFIESRYLLYDVSLLDAAELPLQPISPRPVRDVGLALVLGLALGSLLAILREQLHTPFNSLRQRNAFDPGSSAYTRRYLERRLEEELSRTGNEGLSFGLIQLNELEELIDTLPRPVVQQFLHRLTNVLHNEVRGKDIVGRWNATSFAILLPDTPEPVALQIVERIRQVLSEPMELYQNGDVVHLHPQAGVTTTYDNEPASLLVEQAEVALKRADRKEVGTVHFSHDLLHPETAAHGNNGSAVERV